MNYNKPNSYSKPKITISSTQSDIIQIGKNLPKCVKPQLQSRGNLNSISIDNRKSNRDDELSNYDNKTDISISKQVSHLSSGSYASNTSLYGQAKSKGPCMDYVTNNFYNQNTLNNNIKDNRYNSMNKTSVDYAPQYKIQHLKGSIKQNEFNPVENTMDSFISDKDDMNFSNLNITKNNSTRNQLINNLNQTQFNQSTLRRTLGGNVSTKSNVNRQVAFRQPQQQPSYINPPTYFNTLQYKSSSNNNYNQNTFSTNKTITSKPSTINYLYQPQMQNHMQPQPRPQLQIPFSQNTINTRSSNNSKTDLHLNIEDLLLQEEKLTDIIEDLASDPSNTCYEWWNFYGYSSLSGKYENFFKDQIFKNIIKEHMMLEFISVIICYDCEIYGVMGKMEKRFTEIFNYIHQSMLLFSDYLLSKISSSCVNNIWVNKLKQLVRTYLKLIPNNKAENISVIQYHNENVNFILKEILKEHPGKEKYLDTIYNYLFNPQTCSLLILSDIFRNKILKFKNAKGSILASSVQNNIAEGLIENSKEPTKIKEVINNYQPIKPTTTINTYSKSTIKTIKETKENTKEGIRESIKSNSNKAIERLSVWNKKYENEEPEFNPSMAARTSIVKNNSISPDKIITDKPCNEVIQTESKEQLVAEQIKVSEDNKNSSSTSQIFVEHPYTKNIPLNKKYCLVLDLDETLIHYKVDAKNPDDGEMLIRPYMYDFLTSLDKYYELILFTAGTEEVRLYNYYVKIVWNSIIRRNRRREEIFCFQILPSTYCCRRGRLYQRLIKNRKTNRKNDNS